jgi:hypothetical protein
MEYAREHTDVHHFSIMRSFYVFLQRMENGTLIWRNAFRI